MRSLRTLQVLQVRRLIHSDHFAVLVFVPHNTEYNTVLFQVLFASSGGKALGTWLNGAVTPYVEVL